MKSASGRIRRDVREPNYCLLDVFTVDRHLVDFAQTAILGCTDIVCVRIAPTTLCVTFESIALGTVVLRTTTDLPAGDEGMNMLDALDTQFLFGNGSSDAL
jgi:hypothetical protein